MDSETNNDRQRRGVLLNWGHMTMLVVVLVGLPLLGLHIMTSYIFEASNVGEEWGSVSKAVKQSARSGGPGKGWPNSLVHGTVIFGAWGVTSLNGIYVLVFGPFWANRFDWRLLPTLRLNWIVFIIASVMMIAFNWGISAIWSYSTNNEWY